MKAENGIGLQKSGYKEDEAEELFRRILYAHTARLGRYDYETSAAKEALGLLRKKRRGAEFKIPISDLILDE